MKINYVRACAYLLLSLLISIGESLVDPSPPLPPLINVACIVAVGVLLYWLMPTGTPSVVEFEEVSEEEFEEMIHE